MAGTCCSRILSSRDAFGLADADFQPTYNAAPSQDSPVILDDSSERLASARWGLVPE